MTFCRSIDTTTSTASATTWWIWVVVITRTVAIGISLSVIIYKSLSLGISCVSCFLVGVILAYGTSSGFCCLPTISYTCPIIIATTIVSGKTTAIASRLRRGVGISVTFSIRIGIRLSSFIY